MKRFNEFLDEDIIKEDIFEEQNLVVFCWGRFNPPTKGHGMVFSKAYSYAQKKQASFYIFTSQTQDDDKNPLSYEDKIKALKAYFPQYSRHIVYSPKIKTLFNVVDKLISNDFDRGWLVVGDDRVNTFQEQMEKYYKEKLPITVMSAGFRSGGEPFDEGDTEDMEYVSGSSAREAAKSGDYAKFKSLSPTNVSDKKAKGIFHLIRKAYGINNIEQEEQEMNIPPEREEFFKTRNEWKEGDMIITKESSKIGEIVSVGPNFIKVKFLDEDKEASIWPWDVQKL